MIAESFVAELAVFVGPACGADLVVVVCVSVQPVAVDETPLADVEIAIHTK